MNLPGRSLLQKERAVALTGVLARPSHYRIPAVPPIRVPIPESFYSAETGEPLEECLVCDRSLLNGSTEYLIEKGYRQYEAYDVQETVFEFALCMDCHATMRQSFSESSMRRCQAYLSEHVDLAGRAGGLLKAEPTDPSEWTRRCIVHDTPREELDEFQIMAQCQGTEMWLTHLPLLMGGPAMDELGQRLSNETIDELGGFRDEHFGLPPELKHDLQGPVVV